MVRRSPHRPARGRRMGAGPPEAQALESPPPSRFRQHKGWGLYTGAEKSEDSGDLSSARDSSGALPLWDKKLLLCR